MVAVGQKISVELPEVLGETFEELAMSKEAWHQFLVMTIFVNPTQCQLGGQAVELGSIITEQSCNHWVLPLGSVGRDAQGFFHALA